MELGSKGGDALTFNGGKSALNEGLEVSGTVIYVKGSSAVTVNDTVSFNNNLKNANIRTVTDSLGSAESVGGSAVIVASGSLTVDSAARKVTLNGNPVPLTATEFDLLALLTANAGAALSRDKILAAVWGWDYIGETRTVDVHVQHLRSKLGTDAIETVYKYGYRWSGGGNGA